MCPPGGCPRVPLQPLVRQPLSARRKLLRESFEEVEGKFVFATSADTRSAEEVSEFLDKAIKGEPGHRGERGVGVVSPLSPPPHFPG